MEDASLKTQQRREELKRLLPRQLTITEIAKTLEVSRGTVYRDLQAMRDEIGLMLKITPPEAFLADYTFSRKAILRELWSLYYREGLDANTKLGVLNSIAKREDKFMDLLVQLGFVRSPTIRNASERLLDGMKIEDVKSEYRQKQKSTASNITDESEQVLW